MTIRRTSILFAVLALGALCAAASHAAQRATQAAIHSSAYYGAARESVGDVLSAAGDVNGDKRADIITSSSQSHGAVVVFGSSSNSSLDLSRLGRRGFRILAPGVSGGVQSVAGAGDVNHDGLSDLLVGTPVARDSGGVTPGSAYVVFGKRSRSAVDITKLGVKGFRIVGERRRDHAGAGVAGGGDINGDGFADVIVGAPQAEVSDHSNAGSAYVVFGKRTTSTVELSTLGGGGIKVAGARSGEQVGNAVARTSDMNGDKLDELVLGASNSDSGGRNSGAAYVVYGRQTAGAVNLSQLGNKGFLIKGAAAREGDGFAVAGLKDVNGDRLGDIAIGAPAARYSGHASGSAYVVFGRPAPGTVDLAKLSSAGYRLDGVAGDVAGFSVAGTSDQSRDGRGELIVGAPGADVGRVMNAGTAYVIYGTGARKPRRLDRLGNGGFRLSKMRFLGSAGTAVAEAGDVNGDGRSEVVVGVPGANYDGRTASGAAYLFRGL
jgi:hypothetical protein